MYAKNRLLSCFFPFYFIFIVLVVRVNCILFFFIFTGNLKAHILRVHNATEGEPTYACSYCSCVFKKLGSLNGHIKRVHTNVLEVDVRDIQLVNNSIYCCVN